MPITTYYRYYTDKPDAPGPVHYERNWSDALGNFVPEFPIHYFQPCARIAAFALPLLSMAEPRTGVFISAVSVVSHGIELILKWRDAQNSPTTLLIWLKDIFKNAIELLSLKDLNAGLFAHNSIDLAERIACCYKTPQVDKIIEIVSSALYLISLYPFRREISYRLILASMVNQAALSLYRAYLASEQWVIHGERGLFMESLFHVITAICRAAQAYFCYARVQLVKQAFQKQHLIVCVDNINGHEDLVPRLALELETLRKAYGDKALTVVMPEHEADRGSGVFLASELKAPAVPHAGLDNYFRIQPPQSENLTSQAVEAVERLARTFIEYPRDPSILPLFIIPYTSTSGRTNPDVRIFVAGLDGKTAITWEESKL